MKTETIKEITVNDKNELSLKIQGEGNADYQYVYREAAGVYWNEKQKAFESTPIQEWTIPHWFGHICEITKIGLCVELALDSTTNWGNIPESEKYKIETLYIKT